MLKGFGSNTEDPVAGLSTELEKIQLAVFPDGTKLQIGMTKKAGNTGYYQMLK